MRSFALLLLALVPTIAIARPLEALHGDPIAPVILGVTGILSFAVLGRFAARKLNLPSVLGELVIGVVLGNLAYIYGIDLIVILREGPAIFDIVEHVLVGTPVDEAAVSVLGAKSAPSVLTILQGPMGAQLVQVAHTVDVFSRYGVIFLLFLVGLETSVQEMRRVGGEAVRVAVVGVILPFALGLAVVHMLMPELPFNTGMFIAATLGATSIGISSRVLKDMHRERSPEARIILGAAVIDDVLGLLMLAIVSGIVVRGGVAYLDVASIIVLALLFLGSTFYLGPLVLRFIVRLLRHLDVVEAKMFVAYLFVMMLAWVANLVGLSTIIGAFAAGLILHDSYFDELEGHKARQLTIKDMVMPLEVILVPIFFVLMGIQVKLELFFHWDVILLAIGLLVAAIAGKVACGLVVRGEVNKLAIGFGMMPRGEVGLIFAAIGKSLGVINDELFSAVVMMVIITTLAAPLLLKLTLQRE